MKRVENILYYLALFVMAVLMSCDDKSQICDFQDDNQDLVTLSDMEGTISYNNEEKSGQFIHMNRTRLMSREFLH